MFLNNKKYNNNTRMMFEMPPLISSKLQPVILAVTSHDKHDGNSAAKYQNNITLDYLYRTQIVHCR